MLDRIAKKHGRELIEHGIGFKYVVDLMLVSSGEDALGMAERRQFDVAVLDMVMPGLSGLQLLEKLKSANPECEVIMLTGQGTIETAVQAMKLGAIDFLSKPFPLAELEILIENAYETGQLRKENRQLKTVLRRSQTDTEIIGKSAAMQEVFRLIDRAGPTDKAILIQGESGTGKELVARALHRQSCANRQAAGCDQLCCPSRIAAGKRTFWP